MASSNYLDEVFLICKWVSNPLDAVLNCLIINIYKKLKMDKKECQQFCTAKHCHSLALIKLKFANLLTFLVSSV